MIIRSLELFGYRNYKEAAFEFATGTNIFYGDNAQGKTNALEAIFYSATGKSYKGTKDKDIITFGHKEGHIKLIAEKDGVPHRIDMHLKRIGHKGIAINGISLKRAVELFGTVHVILFAPEDLSIIKSAPAERRNFIDVSLCQLDKIYTHNLINYNKIIIQKNKLLKQIDTDPSLKDTIAVWNEQLVTYGKEVISKRKEFIEEINKIVKEIHFSLTDGKEDLEVTYAPCCNINELEQMVNNNIEREIAAKVALYGPHRDDINFKINGTDVRAFGSQGQQRTAALSLKLSEIEIVKRRVNDTPVLLLDDVLSELDEGRSKRLLSCIEGIQTIITCTGIDELTLGNFKIDKTFLINKGNIIEEK